MTRTNAYTLLCVVIRACAVWSLAAFLIGLPAQLSQMYSVPGTQQSATWIAAGLVFTALVIAGAWLYADKLARLALARPQEQVFDSQIEPTVWLGLAISAIGAWHLFNGLIDAAYLLTKAAWMRAIAVDVYEYRTTWPQLWPDIIATAVQLLIAVVCLLRGQGLARILRRLRYGKALAD
ncbi:MAG: hypothetical protein ACREP7_08255 [Lysobacter sp.]